MKILLTVNDVSSIDYCTQWFTCEVTSAISSSQSYQAEYLSLRYWRISLTITVQSVAKISPTITNGKIIDVAALVVFRVVRDLPTCPIRHDARWTHISDLRLADTEYGVPGRVEVLLGVDIFTDILLDGWQKGPPGSPTAMETIFGWVLCGSTEFLASHPSVATACHASIEMKDDLIRKFWEIEELPNQVASHLSMEEHIISTPITSASLMGVLWSLCQRNQMMRPLVNQGLKLYEGSSHLNAPSTAGINSSSSVQ